ncbi:MAG: trans-2-enoyl-CoA reductase family protein [Treponema sp.]|nr:trans-2-enoyl-CoA reductase family protein [Candidatus Treponema scatequi]
MLVTPKIRSNICLNAHPAGCAQEVRRQIEYVKAKKAARAGTASDTCVESDVSLKSESSPRFVLVLGCSTGYGLASRIAAAFEYGADTIGVSFEKEGTETRGGTPGFYNNMAFDKEAKAAGVNSITINGDAYSHEIKKRVIEEIKKLGKKVDLVIYSLASPVRTDPDTQELYKSVIKPIGRTYEGKCLDIIAEKLTEAKAEPASEEEIATTVKVMGGADWKLWIDALTDSGCLATGCTTLAYSYIGPELSHAIYRDGTIGEAKKDLEKTARELDLDLQKKIMGHAYVSVNKGLVTRSSAVIPVISLYLACLFKVMKANGTHEGCIEQMERLFAEKLFAGGEVPLDDEKRIRMDDLELTDEVQKATVANMNAVTEENMAEYCDLAGYKHDFLSANGFDVDGVDYGLEVERFDMV